MFLIFGFGKQIIKQLGIVPETICRSCHKPSRRMLLLITEWFTLFFLPIFPYKSSYVLVCPLCNYSQTVSKEVAQWYLQNLEPMDADQAEQQFHESQFHESPLLDDPLLDDGETGEEPVEDLLAGADSFAEREKKLEAKEAELQARIRALEDREKNLNERETMLKDREKAFGSQPDDPSGQ